MTTAPAEPKKRQWTGLIKYAVGVVLLALVLLLNWEDKGDQPGLRSLLQRTPDWGLFGCCLLLTAGVLATQYVRWYGLVRALDLPFTLRDAVRLGMVGTFYNTFLPGAIGGDFVKAFFIAKGAPGRRAAAVSTVVADRALGLFGLLVFGGVVGGVMWASGNERIAANPTLQWIVLGSAAAAGVVALGYVTLLFIPTPAAARFEERLKGVPKVGPTLAELWETGIRYSRRPGAILVGVGLSAVGHLMMMLQFHLAVQIYPPADLSKLGTFAEHIVIAPIGFIMQAVLPVPGGLGVAEFTFGGLYNLIRPGGGTVVGLTGRLALRVIELILGGVCYVVYLTMKAELPGTTGPSTAAAVEVSPPVPDEPAG